jgi:hypothetical protein
MIIHMLGLKRTDFLSQVVDEGSIYQGYFFQGLPKVDKLWKNSISRDYSRYIDVYSRYRESILDIEITNAISRIDLRYRESHRHLYLPLGAGICCNVLESWLYFQIFLHIPNRILHTMAFDHQEVVQDPYNESRQHKPLNNNNNH